MNNLPRQILRQIVGKYGKEICSDARRCENLLNDLCGNYRREINVLVNAIEERVPLDLLAANRSMPIELLLRRLENRLEEQTALTADAASWAIESWALALNLVTESEIQAKRNRIETAVPTISETETVQPGDSAGKSSNVNPHNPIQPTITPTTIPPIMRQPTQTPKSSSPVIFPTSSQPLNFPSVQVQQANQPVIARKGIRIFRGCFIVIIFLAITSIVLFLGVPYAIEVMRETQREHNNEPPRFPVR